MTELVRNGQIQLESALMILKLYITGCFSCTVFIGVFEALHWAICCLPLVCVMSAILPLGHFAPQVMS